MNYLTSKLVALVIGVAILMTGILINREPEQSLWSSLIESLVSGVFFLLSFGTEVLVLENI